MLFGVCPHDTSRNMPAWLNLSVYLRKRLDWDVQIGENFDFESFYTHDFNRIEIAYVNPMDAWKLNQDRGFVPICKTELPDEVVFIAAPDIPEPTLETFAEQPIACVDRQFATYLGFYTLQNQGIYPGKPEFLKSWLKVVRSLMTGEQQYGVLYKDFYDQLSNLAKKQVNAFHTTSEGIATHTLMLSPDFQEHVEPLRKVLLEMEENEEGKPILAELGIGRWQPMSNLEKIKNIIEGVHLSQS